MRRHRQSLLLLLLLLVVLVVVEVGHEHLAVTHRVRSLLAQTVVSIAGEAGTPPSRYETCMSAPAFGHSNSSGRWRSSTT